jgi:DNA anti-recombination protein RmuC
VWEFLGSVLEQHGLAAVLVLATYAGLGFAIRELWKRLHTERDEATKRGKEHAEALEKIAAAAAVREAALLRDEHEKRSLMRAEHERELSKLQAAVLADSKEFAARLHQLQDRRNDELREILRESLEHMGETRASVEKITEAMSTLREVVRR